MIDLSISIVNCDNRDLLAGCLDSIYQTVQRACYEILVVDNGSTDGSADMMRTRFPAIQMIENEERLGYAASHNRALRRCQGRYLLVLNDDMLVLIGAIDTMVAFMDAHPDAGMVGCRLLNPDRSLQPSCRAFPNLWIMFCRSLYLDKLFPRNRWFGADYLSGWGHDAMRKVDVIKGCCMLVRREVVDQVGLLDERFFMYYEETDWCYRTLQHGWKVYFTPDAQVIHFGEQSTGRQSARMALIQRQSLLWYFRKHHGGVAASIVRLLSILEISLRLAYWAFTLPLRRRQAYASHKIGLYWTTLRWLLTGRPATAW